MYTCAHCSKVSCRDLEKEKLPQNCPMRENVTMEMCIEKYHEDDNLIFFQVAAAVEAEGYCEWPRLREVGEFCRKMQYKRIGVAFCVGLKREAKTIVDVLGGYGLAVDSVACKTGGVDKQDLGISPCHYVRQGDFEAMCNPIAQAEYLNKVGSEFNVVVGLCVGHDSLFYKYSNALVTTLIAKDRALAHNPVGAVYCAEGYLKKKLTPQEM